MPRERDSVVKDSFKESPSNDGKGGKAICKYCQKSYVPNTTRQRNHILRECREIPANIKMRYVEFPLPTSSGPDIGNEEFNAEDPVSIEIGT